MDWDKIPMSTGIKKVSFLLDVYLKKGDVIYILFI